MNCGEKDEAMTAIRVKMGTNGRLVIPANLRREVGLDDGETVLIETVKGELRVRPMEDVISNAQHRLKKYVASGVSLAEELISDRRAEAKREA